MLDVSEHHPREIPSLTWRELGKLSMGNNYPAESKPSKKYSGLPCGGKHIFSESYVKTSGCPCGMTFEYSAGAKVWRSISRGTTVMLYRKKFLIFLMAALVSRTVEIFQTRGFGDDEKMF